MHLKTLTLRGFKSFASATSLEFEPGITCVVGPNGSGKSNVVDALAWVMGEQGAKTLRGGKMDDVIFAGTSGRAPLGRAEVSLTIDNTDGALPIEYTEVTISRTLFRSGGSEYAINGNSCRLLDIQELLSDSGLGREMHVIVGQGQLDAVLSATPEDRRHFIEEAAGILKHRRRKEKALRKLDSMQGNLTRVSDLIAEIRRQLGPLGRQAEVARRAQTIQVDVRDASARLLADDIAQQQAQMSKEQADESALVERREQVETALAAQRDLLASLERDAAAATPELTAANDTYYRLSAIRERLTGLATMADERIRMLGTQADVTPPTDLVDLDEQVERAKAARAELEAEVADAAVALEAAEANRHEVEATAERSERHLANLLRSAADRREGVARLAGQVAAKRSRVESTESEIGRLRDGLDDAHRREREARTEFERLEAEAGDGEVDLGEILEGATSDWDAAKADLEHARAELTAAEKDHATWAARIEALDLSLTRKDGAGELLASGQRSVRGSVAALVEVDADNADAVAAALGPLADAVAVDSVDDAVDAIRWLRDEDAGRARFVVADPSATVTNPSGDLPSGARWASDLILGADALAATVRAFVSGVAVVDDLASARALVQSRADVVAVTARGDVLGSRSASGGAGDAPSILHVQAARDEAGRNAAQAAEAVERTTAMVSTATERESEAKAVHDEVTARVKASDERMAAAAQRLGHLNASARAAQADAERIELQVDDAMSRLSADQQALEDLVERLDAAETAPEQAESDSAEAQQARDSDAQAAVAARARETEARLALRTAEERGRALAARAESLERAAAAERDARARAKEAAERRERQSAIAREVVEGARWAIDGIAHAVERADDARAEVEAARAERSTRLSHVRRAIDEYAEQLRQLTDTAHREELARAQIAMRLEQLEQRAVDELAMTAEQLVEGFGPHLPVPGLDEDGEPVETPYVRSVQEKRLRIAKREMGQLGAVNPLALEEFAALEERHKFLSDQLEDIKKSRLDLLEIVKEIDERVETVFAEAFADTARAFDEVFPRLFPGGTGKLVLSDPKDMLNTGIEIEASPAGKKVKRLSLLSGGERSLTAVAMLVSIFKARPSPFYVMDEVEAALDDTNLGRLLEIFRELQEDSQLIVVTHQKRTMEVADALYGITMRGDGVTTVISQRLGDHA